MTIKTDNPIYMILRGTGILFIEGRNICKH